jgi:hypothetical protein
MTHVSTCRPPLRSKRSGATLTPVQMFRKRSEKVSEEGLSPVESYQRRHGRTEDAKWTIRTCLIAREPSGSPVQLSAGQTSE